MEKKNYRIESIDLLRGVIMVIMALDHVRVYFNYGTFYGHPTDLAHTTPLLFFTRWITHVCAPIFVFLAGTSAYLYGSRKKDKKELSMFLLTRGIWLIFLELTVVNFAWTFDVTLSLHIFQVIWAIGFSMVVLAALVFLPYKMILITGAVLVAFHNFLDPVIVEGGQIKDIIWYMLHQQKMLPVTDSTAILFFYPVLPWVGTMALGFTFGKLYAEDFEIDKRKKLLLILGSSAVGLFILLRSGNFYGDAALWEQQESFVFSILSFINTTKYPPSLLYLFMTIGPAMFFLYFTENIKNKFTDAMVAFGRVPLFYYVIHLYFIHLLGILGLVYAGRNWVEMILSAEAFQSGKLAEHGFNLAIVYAIWVGVVFILYPVCKWYLNYKTANRGKWWVSYI